LLTQEKWHKTTQHGKEPVQFVENIRSYYELLVRLTEENQKKKNVIDVDSEKPALTIDPAVL